ncbi:MAG: (d)CMP kinase [Pseudomonadota bacterium]
MNVPVIAIDGVSGSGKGTLAAEVARRLGWHLLDSGALYRVVGVVCEHRGVELGDEAAVVAVSQRLRIEFKADGVWVDDEDLSDAIRTEEAGTLASLVAQLPRLRAAIMQLQRDFARAPGLVADGRDMGTVVFPSAPLKIFLEASPEERARRRYNQLKNKGLSVSLPALLAQIEERDARDRGRAVAPLEPAPDAHVLDSTKMSIHEVVDAAMRLIAQQGLLDTSSHP